MTTIEKMPVLIRLQELAFTTIEGCYLELASGKGD